MPASLHKTFTRDKRKIKLQLQKTFAKADGQKNIYIFTENFIRPIGSLSRVDIFLSDIKKKKTKICNKCCNIQKRTLW